MPYKNPETRKLKANERGKIKKELPCCICGNPAFARPDTIRKYGRITCSAECKSILLKEIHTTVIDENAFVSDYLKGECGYQALAKKYGISGKRALGILRQNDIKILDFNEARDKMRSIDSGNWLKAEFRVCKRCGKSFKFRKGGTSGLYCSHLCYMKYSGRTTIEESVAKLLTELSIDFVEQFKIKRKYYDFYLPKFNTLIECDGDYWHSLPENKQNDIVKNELAKELGYNLIRFTETEINTKLDHVKDVLCSLR